MVKMDQTRTDCNLTRMGFPGETPLFSGNSFHFFWFFSVTMSMRKLLMAFSSERGLKGCRYA
jgi:hypothetical protein